MLHPGGERLRRQQGAYYTPPHLVQPIVDATITRPGLRVLDPACGDGAFLTAAYRRLLSFESQPVPPERAQAILRASIFGIDIDPAAVQQARLALPGANLAGADFLTASPFPGAFDVILGNPPYRRERGHKALLDRIAATPLGQRYRAPRMDLWYYFAHRALELLASGGVLSFLVNSYWTTNRGAARLVEHLRAETHLEEIQCLDGERSFPGVSSYHLIFRARKTGVAGPTRIVRNGEAYTKAPADLYREGAIDLLPDPAGALARLEGRPRLDEFGVVRQGIAENPARAGGRGVFVLTPEEAAQSGVEPELIRPYHAPRDITRDGLRPASLRLIYSTPHTCPDLAQYPGLAHHLAPFRDLLEARRETRLGKNRWWRLHWPRDPHLWTSPKILAPQMVEQPTFVAVQEPVWVNFSVNVFLPHPAWRGQLNAIAAALNSAETAEWFRHHAKVRGGRGLEINGHVLARAPITNIP